LAIQQGKHVLCEKPFTLNARDAREVIDLARQHKVIIMEAMWTRFFPAIYKVTLHQAHYRIVGSRITAKEGYRGY
jgi:predicted dehydrogenase